VNQELGASGVPYFAQWESAELAQRFVDGSLPLAGDPCWAGSGARTAAEYEYWANKVCGLACLKMILASRGLPVPPMMRLVERALSWRAYIPQGDRVAGLVYRPFADWVAAEYVITVEVAEDLPVAAVTAAASARVPVIASVHSWIRGLRAVLRRARHAGALSRRRHAVPHAQGAIGSARCRCLRRSP
jgi:hypothetical protein